MDDPPTDDEDLLDMTAINADIAAGARAYGELLNNVREDWGRWTIIICGLRALRDLARAKAHTRDIKSWHYRQELAALLQRRPYSVYDHIDKQTRSLDQCHRCCESRPAGRHADRNQLRVIATAGPRALRLGPQGSSSGRDR
jgi:hypothetical protein